MGPQGKLGLPPQTCGAEHQKKIAKICALVQEDPDG